MSAPRLYIATQDPVQGGGVTSMVEFVYSTAQDAGYDPCLVYNSLDRRSQIRLSTPHRALRSNRSRSIQHGEVRGMEGKGVPIVFPEIEFTQFLLNSEAWQESIEDGDLFFSVGGTNHCSIPFVRAHERFGSWTATLMWDDRRDRLATAPLIERVRDRLSRPVLEYLEHRAYTEADPIYVLSEYTARRVRSEYDIPAERVEVVPYPIDTGRFCPDASGEQLDGSSVVLFVGRLNDPRKNVELLVRAFSEVRRDVPDAELWLVGDDPDPELEALVDRSGASESVRFVGPVPNDELPAYYRSADVFAMPSNQEGLGIVGLEAMACGTPVVSTRCGGPEQYVDDGETGYLVPVGHVDALADGLRSILTDADDRERMGRIARRSIERVYDADDIRERFVEAFDRLRESNR